MAQKIINGRIVDWADIKVYIAGVPVADIVEINWKESQEKELQHSTGIEPIGSSHGNRVYEGDFSLLLSEAEKFEEPLRKMGKSPLDLAPFTIVVTWAEKVATPVEGSPHAVVERKYSPTKSRTLLDVEIKDVDWGISQNDKNAKVKYSFIFRKLK